MLSLPLQNYNDATDSGELRPGLEAEQVSPGLIGFLITFVMVAVVVALIVDMVRRQRRLRYRADYARAREEAESGAVVHPSGASSGDPRAEGAATTADAPGAPPGAHERDDSARDQERPHGGS